MKTKHELLKEIGALKLQVKGLLSANDRLQDELDQARDKIAWYQEWWESLRVLQSR